MHAFVITYSSWYLCPVACLLIIFIMIPVRRMFSSASRHFSDAFHTKNWEENCASVKTWYSVSSTSWSWLVILVLILICIGNFSKFGFHARQAGKGRNVWEDYLLSELVWSGWSFLLLEQTTSHCLFWGAPIFDQRQRPKADDHIICWKCDWVVVGQCLSRVIMFGRHMEVIVFIRHPLTEMFIYHPQIILFSALTPHRGGISIKLEPKKEKY